MRLLRRTTVNSKSLFSTTWKSMFKRKTVGPSRKPCGTSLLMVHELEWIHEYNRIKKKQNKKHVFSTRCICWQHVDCLSVLKVCSVEAVVEVMSGDGGCHMEAIESRSGGEHTRWAQLVAVSPGLLGGNLTPLPPKDQPPHVLRESKSPKTQGLPPHFLTACSHSQLYIFKKGSKTTNEDQTGPVQRQEHRGWSHMSS